MPRGPHKAGACAGKAADGRLREAGRRGVRLCEDERGWGGKAAVRVEAPHPVPDRAYRPYRGGGPPSRSGLFSSNRARRSHGLVVMGTWPFLSYSPFTGPSHPLSWSPPSSALNLNISTFWPDFRSA